MYLRNKPFHIICFFLVLLIHSLVLAQPVEEKKEQVLSHSVLTQLQDEKPFSYYLDLTDNKSSIISRLRNMLEWFFSKLFNNQVTFTFSNVLPYIIIVLVVVLIALKLTGLSLSKIMKPSLDRINELGYFNDNESIQKADFNKLISGALEKGDYRIAIRFSYLLLLQQLDTKGYIQWESQKSNFDYLLAVQNNSFFNEFNSVTQVYENAWYGEMPWTPNEYKFHFNEMLRHVTIITKSIIK